MESSYYVWKAKELLCGDCANERVDSMWLTTFPLRRPFVCDGCNRQILPGEGSQPAEDVRSDKVTPDVTARWHTCSVDAIRRIRAQPGFNSEWRPATYWPSLPSDEDLVTRLRGARRRERLREALASGDFSHVDAGEVREALSVEERRELMNIHPHLTLGEYLPEFEDQDIPFGEVEIARLYIHSGIGNTISIRANRGDADAGTDLALRAVDEFGETLSTEPHRISKPLSYEELLMVIKSLEWVGPFAHGPVWWTRELEGNDEPERGAEFITGESGVYPIFEALIDEDNAAWLEARYSEWEQDDDDE